MAASAVDWCKLLMFGVGIAKEWQTLIAGLLALFGAYLTIRVINRQMRAQELQFKKIQTSKSWAARARIADALSDLTTFNSNAVRAIVHADAPTPAPPLEAIEALKAVIEHSEPAASERTFKLVTNFQVYRSRLESFIQRRSDATPLSSEVSELLYDAAFFQALTNSLYDYARNDSEHGPTDELSNEDVMTGLSNALTLGELSSNRENYEDVIATIERRHPLN